jgi:Ca-activated chloride channel family protein
MNDFHFANPAYLSLLVAVFGFWAFVRFSDRRVRDRLAKFLHEANMRQLLIDKGTVRERGKRAAFWLGLSLATIALARPQANPQVEELTSSGLDIYVLLDTSRSMDTEDVAPSRLKKAKREIQHLTARLSGDRVGIVAFANSAVLVSPLTNDYGILDQYLQNIDTNVVPSQGTNFAVALETAKDAMERGAKNSTVNAQHTNIFLMLSDGEDHADTDFRIVDQIKKEGGLIFTVAFGTEAGGKIPVRDEKGELRGFKKDSAGNEVVTKVEPKTLQEIAQRGGGQFYHATQDEAEIEDILARVNDAQRGSYTTIKTTIWEEYFWVFLAPGLFLLLISFVSVPALVPSFGRIRDGFAKLRARKAATAALLLFWLLPQPRAQAGLLSFFYNKDRKASEQSAALAKEKKYGEAAESLKGLQAENPDSPEVNYDIGTYLLADKKGELGREQLGHLRNADGVLRDLADFNTAGSWAQEGKKDEARAVYADLIQRLQGKPHLSKEETQLLADAKRNVARLADPAQQPKPDQQQQQQQQNQQQQKDQNQGGDSQQKQQQNGQSKDNPQDQKNQGNKEDNKQGKSDEKKDDKGKGDEKKEDKGKPDDKKDEKSDKGDQKKDDKGQQQPQGQQPQGAQQGGQLPARHGGQPFKDRDDMGEGEARRILGALKERESDLQKKLMKNQIKGGRVNVDDAGKDW